MGTQRSMHLLPETRNELSSLVRDDGVGDSMQTENVLNVYLCISLGLVTGMNKNEVSRLHESINNLPDRIILTGSQRQTHDEIHIDIFPLPGRSIQWLQQTSKPQMICIDHSTSVAFWHIASSLAFHSCPLELRFQVMIHFGVAGVNRILGCVCASSKIFSPAPGHME
jgi:hypothetical protein